MGVELVEAADLIVDDDIVWMRTIAGRVKVDVIYRRIDDDYLDPLVFRPDSALGVRGLIAAYAAGNVAIINAPGNGIADDKAIYSYMPEIVRYYTGAEAKLPNVQTFRCREPEALKYTLDHLGRAGGEAGRRLGRLRHAGRADRVEGRDRQRSAPRWSPSRIATSRNRRWRCRLSRHWSRRASRRAMSISVRSC